VAAPPKPPAPPAPPKPAKTGLTVEKFVAQLFSMAQAEVSNDHFRQLCNWVRSVEIQK
jgi:hypothetical protein